MADLRSIFNLPAEGSPKTTPRKTPTKREKRPEGVKREVFELQQNSKSFRDNVDIPVHTVQTPKKIYKEKRICKINVSKWLI